MPGNHKEYILWYGTLQMQYTESQLHLKKSPVT